MTTYVSAQEAAARLGVQASTLYAYVSRGRVRRVRSVDGRRSLFALDEITALAGERRSSDGRAAFVPVQIDTSITELGEATLRFRGHDAVELARTVSFEQVAELLWTGQMRPEVGPWVPPESIHLDAERAAAAIGGSIFSRLSAAMLVTGRTIEGGDAIAGARILLAAAPSAFGAPMTGPMARRVAKIWAPTPDRWLIDAVGRVMVLLADHELATCALAARVAASTRTELAGCLVAALSALSGPLHGGAARGVHLLLLEAESTGGVALIDRHRRARTPVPGFGHKVYKSGDPRVAPILESARVLSGSEGKLAVVDDFIHAAAQRLPVAPNVDLALGVLSYLAGLPAESTEVMFAIARLAGIVAHVLEEYEAAPVRYRTTARYIPSSVASES